MYSLQVVTCFDPSLGSPAASSDLKPDSIGTETWLGEISCPCWGLFYDLAQDLCSIALASCVRITKPKAWVKFEP